MSSSSAAFSRSHSVEWRSIDPRNGSVVPYSAADIASIEASYQKDRNGTYQIFLGGAPFTIDFKTMRQYNTAGGNREVRRHVFSDESTAVGGTTDAEKVAALIKSLKPSTIKSAFESIQAMDGVCDFIMENISSFKNMFERSKELDLFQIWHQARINTTPIIDVMNVILRLMCVGTLANSEVDFNVRGSFEQFYHLTSIGIGSPVPTYFANVRGGDIFSRKYSSVLGLRNLVIHGPEIFAELFETLFSSDPLLYNQTGSDKMRYLTGNVVDLDTVVMNCTQQLKEINNLRKSENRQPFSNPSEFFSSPDTHAMVLHQADHVLKVFIDTMKLSPKTAEARRLVLPTSPPLNIPIACHNSDRGKWPVWGYSNVGVFTYHANAAHLPDVVGALLKAPFHIVKAFIMTLSRSDIIPEDVAATTSVNVTDATTAKALKNISDFFDKAVNDSCFNAKWKAIESYIDEISSVDDIRAVIGKLQEANQHIFTSQLYDSDDENRTKECAELVKLISQYSVKGRDPLTKTIRLLCKQDIEKWIIDTN